MTARSTFTRLIVVGAASLLLAGIALMIQVSTKRSAASSAPPAVQDADAPTVARTAEPPAATAETRRAASDVSPPLAAKEGTPADPAGARPGVAGMVVGIDPETGKLGMPTPEQLKKLSDLEQQRIDHSPADLVEVHHPDGSVSVDLQGRFQEYATVRIGPDGKKIFQCVDGRENAEKVLKGPAPGTAGSGAAEAAPAPQQPEER